MLGGVDGGLEAVIEGLVLEVAEGFKLDSTDGVLDAVMLGIADIPEGMLDGRDEGSFVGTLVGGGLGAGVGLFV